jgi:hypothetical protein
MVRSQLFPAVVLLGISAGATLSSCGESRRDADPASEDPHADGQGGDAGRIAGDDGAGTAGAGAGGAGGSRAGVGGSLGNAGAGDAGTGGTSSIGGTGGAGASGAGSGSESVGGEGGEPEPGIGGIGASGGRAGTGGHDGDGGVAGGIADAGADAPTDAFCDTTWPTTKGNPAAPPTCEDQAECGPLPDAGFRKWLTCSARIGDTHCDYFHVTSVCEGGAWRCPPDGMLPDDCRCFGPTPEGKACTEQGFLPVDAGSGDAG